MERRAKIELCKEEMKFSAGHFTIFSARERENMHGHNFFLHLETEARVLENGLAFDYGTLKSKLLALCQSLNEIFLLPAHSPYLRIEQAGGQVIAVFGEEKLVFLERDVKLLPIRNVTLEELSAYLLNEILRGWAEDPASQLLRVTLKVFSGPGQSASSEWTAP